MAQYYQVLNQEDKTPEEATEFFPNIEENQTVQYVIADGSQPQFQAQPVVMSEPLMVVERQQQLIIDQSQVTYASSPYVIQDASAIDFQNNQQVYYMANPPQNQSVIVEQQIAPQPVVLNHQVMQNHITKINVGTPVHPVNANAQGMQDKLLKTQAAPVAQNVMGRNVNAQKFATPGVTREIVQNFPHNNSNESEDDNEDTVTLPDGRVISFEQYQRILAIQKRTQSSLGRIATPVISTVPQRKPRVSPPNRARNVTPKARPVPRLNRHLYPNTSFEDAPYEETKPGPLKQTVGSQFQNTMPRQHMNNRPTTQVPESQSQFLIQPRLHGSKPPVQKPLPSFLRSTQIQSIIDSAPNNDEYNDSIRMLVLLENGEQRLITFTLPKEACTIQEILEQVGVPFTKDTPIQISETNSSGLNYIVAVGDVGFILEEQPEDSSQSEYGQCQIQRGQIEQDQESNDEYKSSSPETPKELPPKLIEGQLALCSMCGYLSEDFNRCMRCKRRLPEDVKAIPAGSTNGKRADGKIGGVDKRMLLKSNGVPRMNLLPKKHRPSKSKLMESETVVLSSDEEEDEEKKTSVKNMNENILEKLGASVTLSPISKEPSIVDIRKCTLNPIKEKVPADQLASTLVLCRTVRIGSYRFVPPEPIRIDSNAVVFKVPHPKSDNTIKVIKIENCDVVKVLVSFQKSLPVLFYYLLPSVGSAVRSALDMCQGSDYYFDPLSELEESHRRITLLPETLSDECKHTLLKIYGKTSMMEELTYKEANDILIKTCPKEITRSVLNYSMSEIKSILTYPPEGTGRITINTEDYMCLGQDQFLNDVIIDFYLKYLLLNLPKERQEKVHIFSTFFYKRLTTKPLKASRKSQPTELDPNLTAAQKRHSRVKTWTKNVNIFDKDFVIVPINENCHWFLAIICFPNMNGSQTMEGQPIKIEPRLTKKKKAENAAKKKKAEQAIMCDDPDVSDKDEAEGDDSELESDDSEEVPPTPPTLSVENNSKRPPIKQPCILIFDSLAGASRSRVVATLRDYLTCEYKIKMNVDKVFTKDVIKGACPKVPQQNNFTDCGLYLLQYVEHFFNDPIKDYYIPISHLKNWFEEITVTKKREDISLLIQQLMKEAGKDVSLLPDVLFPTLNGELTERALMEKEDRFMDPEEEEDVMEDEDEEYLPPSVKKVKKNESASDGGSQSSESDVLKPSTESAKSKEENEQKVIAAPVMKPNLSDFPKQSNRETLSYLKAKRIIRHKNNSASDDGPDNKKPRNAETGET